MRVLIADDHPVTRRALEAGCTPDQLRRVGVLAITTIGFPSTIAAMSWVEDILRSATLRQPPSVGDADRR